MRESLCLGVVGRNILGSVAPSNTRDELEQREQKNLENEALVPNGGIRGRNHDTWPFGWLLRTRTQFPMLAQQVL